MAVQARLLDWTNLITALDVWNDDRTSAFLQILRRQPGLGDSDCDALEAAIEEHLAVHGNDFELAFRAAMPAPLGKEPLADSGNLTATTSEAADISATAKSEPPPADSTLTSGPSEGREPRHSQPQSMQQSRSKKNPI